MLIANRFAVLILSIIASAVVGADSAADSETRAVGWIDAFNSGEDAYAEYCTSEMAPGRLSVEERLAMYKRVRSDLGLLELEGLEIGGNGIVKAAVHSEHHGPVSLEFRFEPSGEGRITGVGIELGGGGHGEGAPMLPPIEVPSGGLDRAQLEHLVDGWLSRLATDGVFSGVVLLARNGNPVFQRPYGLAERRFAAPVSTATRFNVGSITKAFTTVVVAQLVAEEKLELDAPVARYLSEYPDPDVASRVTIRQLIDHSSGLGDIFGEDFFDASNHLFQEPEDFYPLFAGRPLKFEPGEGNAYSNAGFVVLGAVIESVTGAPYREIVEDRVFAPAGMTGSGFFASDGLEPDVAVGYTARGCRGNRPCRSNLATKVWAGCSAGGSHSPAIDLLRFDEALRSHRLTEPAGTRWVMTRVDPSEGGPADPERALWNWAIAGGAAGVNAELDSDGRDAVVVVANLDPPVAMEIAKALRPVVEAFDP